MTTPTKLDAGQKHILRLIARDRKPDGWATVSAQLIKPIRASFPPELAVFEETESGGRVRLTDEGQAVVNAMAWL